MLNLLPNVIEALKSDLLNELQNIVTNSTQTLIENGQYQQGDHRLLPDLFTVVVDQFHLVVDSFRIMIQSMNTSVDRNQCADSVKFDMAEVWARVQSVMQMMLTVMIFFVTIVFTKKRHIIIFLINLSLGLFGFQSQKFFGLESLQSRTDFNSNHGRHQFFFCQKKKSKTKK